MAGKFTQKDTERLASLGYEGNELFDLNVPGMHEMYDGIVGSQKPEAISRDTTSFSEIDRSVRASHAKHGGDAVVVLSGAYRHMIGGISRLQGDFNIKYVPVGGMQISTETDDWGKKVTADQLRVQMERDIGVAKHLGFPTMEGARATIEMQPHDPNKPTLVIVALNETGLHSLATYRDAGARVYPELEQIIGGMDVKPSFVSYIGEDLFVENIKQIVTADRVDNYPRNAFLQRIYQSGIPVEIGAFGHDDRENKMGFGLGSLGFGGQRSPFKDRLPWDTRLFEKVYWSGPE